jgi:hypothetical protein
MGLQPTWRNRGGTLQGGTGSGGRPIRQHPSMWWGQTVARARGRRGEPFLGLREDGDSPATVLHGGVRLAGEKSGGGAGRGRGG